MKATQKQIDFMAEMNEVIGDTELPTTEAGASYWISNNIEAFNYHQEMEQSSFKSNHGRVW